jgi:ribokinase
MPPKTRSKGDMDNAFVIAVVGGAIMDLVFEVERMPDNDESLAASSLVNKPGGKGSNTAIAIHRAQHEKPAAEGQVPVPIENLTSSRNGFTSSSHTRRNVRVFLNTNVAQDQFGNQLRKSLKSNYIDDSGVETKGKDVRTGTCAVFVNATTKQSRDIPFHGANTDWMPSEPDSVTCLAQGNVPDLIVCQLEIKRETIEEILSTATKHGVPTLFNPSPMAYILSDHYRNMTHLIVNRNEAAVLMGGKLEDLTTKESWENAAKEFLSWGAKNVVITLGEKGAYYATDIGVDGYVAAEKALSIRDTTGAG